MRHTIVRDGIGSASHTSDLFGSASDDPAVNAIDSNAHICEGRAFEAPSGNRERLATRNVSIDLADRVNSRVCLHVPTVVPREVAMP